MIHITKRHSFTVLHSLHSLYQSVYAYMNIRITMVMLLRHTGTRVHNSNAVRAALAKARMSAGYQREPLARCHETLHRWCLRLHLPQCVASWTS